MPRAFVGWTVGLGIALILPPVVIAITAQSGHTEPLDYVELALAGTFSLLLAAILGFFIAEILMRPIRAELGTGASEYRALGLAGRLWLGTVALTLVTTSMIGSLSVDRATSGAGALLPIFAVAIAITAASAALGGPVLATTVLGPLRELIRGTRAVGAGDLDVRARVMAGDEIGELAASFNEMVEGLRDRESLRDHNAALVGELRASRARIVAAGNEARRRVERDLHDGAQQHLILLNLKLGSIARELRSDTDRAVQLVEESRTDLDRALAELRDLAHGIYPQVLTSDGLGAALAEVADAAPIGVEVESDGIGRYESELEAAVYFCCLEALQNAGKYAGDGAAAVARLSESDGELRFEVADDGAGFDPASENGSAGLQNMVDRIGALGGEIQIHSEPGAGTKVSGRVPVGP